jgi:hypothetical protein
MHENMAGTEDFMTASADHRTASLGRWRPALWAFLGALLLLPAVAMQFTEDVRWTGSDFIAAAAIFSAIGCAIELIVRLVDRQLLRAGLICGVIAAGLAIWAEGAVDIV